MRARGLLAVVLAVGLMAAMSATGAAAATRAPSAVELMIKVAPGSTLPGGPDAQGMRPVGPSGGSASLQRIGWRRVAVPADDVARVTHALLRTGVATHVEQPHELRATRVPDDPLFASQWAHTAARTPSAWDGTTGSADVVIAVIDTGVNAVRELEGRVLPGASMLPSEAGTADSNGHGTDSALVAAAAGDNGTGAAGVCWTCRILPVRGLDRNGAGTSESVAAGIVWAADHGATVISLSLASPHPSTLVADAVAYALDRRIPVVAAAGNDGLTTPTFPASLPRVIGVGATDGAGAASSFSNRGPWVTVTAPDCHLVSPIGGAFDTFCGTSAATPYVAGAIGLRQATGRFTGETVDATRAAIAGSARPPATAGTSSGLLQTDALLRWGLPPEPKTAAPAPKPPPRTRYTPVTPKVVLDTRYGFGAPRASVGPQQSLPLTVAGRAGIPRTGVRAVVLNLTVTAASAPSFLTVHVPGAPPPLPGGGPTVGPDAPAVSFGPGRNVSALVIAPVDRDGRVTLANDAGQVQVIADVHGWFGPSGRRNASTFTPLDPVSVLDTAGALGGPGPPLGSRQSIDVRVAGRGGLPATGVTAVAVQVRATDPSATSFLTVWPTGRPRPNPSNLNTMPGASATNLVIVPVGTDGQISVYNDAGTARVQIDVIAYIR